jgi:methyl-accepting chemotaxis protein
MRWPTRERKPDAGPGVAGHGSGAAALPGSRRRSPIASILITMIIVLTGVILSLFYTLKLHDGAREQRITGYALWFATQFNREAMRLHIALAEALSARPGDLDDAVEQIQMRADILTSRLYRFEDGSLDEKFSEQALLLGSRATIEAKARALLAGVQTLDKAGDKPATLRKLHAESNGLVDGTNGLLSRIYQADADERGRERERAYVMARLLLASVAGLALAMFGLLAQQLRQMRMATATRLRMEAVERDNLAKSLELKRRDEQATMLMREAAVADTVGSFNRAMNESVRRLAAMIEDIARQCEEMNAAALAVREDSERAATSSSRAATHVADVARTAGELSLSARDVSRKTTESLDTTGDVRSHAVTSSEAIRELTGAAAEIDSVTKLIASIAGRTNLLALNATIEAARAGESGRGFAVVAAEVKSLAQQTSRAVSDIAGQIKAIQRASELCVRTLDEIGSRVVKLGAIGGQITSIVDDQTHSVERVAGMIDNASADTRNASATARAARDAADRANAAAAVMLRLTADVNAEARRIRREIEEFSFPLEPGVPDSLQKQA